MTDFARVKRIVRRLHRYFEKRPNKQRMMTTIIKRSHDPYTLIRLSRVFVDTD